MKKRKRKINNSSTPFSLRKAKYISIIFAYVTVPNKSEAEKIGRALLEARLAACVNIFDAMTSLYWWDNKIQNENEAVLIVKTTKALFPDVSEKIKLFHSYSCPCILQIPITDGNKEYLKWLMENLKFQKPDSP